MGCDDRFVSQLVTDTGSGFQLSVLLYMLTSAVHVMLRTDRSISFDDC